MLLTTTPLILSFVLFLFHILDGTVNQIEGKAAIGTDGILFTPYFFILKMIHYFLTPPGGCTLLCKQYRYVPPQRVWFLGLSGLKMGIHCSNFSLELRMIFEGTT